jgi:molybdopterin/thiamine biosynthesis adenylyltransferase
MFSHLNVYEGFELPDTIKVNAVYRLLPVNLNPEFYTERTDRNIGWITKEEQEILKNSVVGIAGTGGMGGLLAATLVRAGVGEVRIADSEVFDASNINRQFAAKRTTIDKLKVIETARMVREITDDMCLVIYPDGITENTIEYFTEGCSVICDEIELFAIDARILLHKIARRKNVSLFNCNTTGFSTNLFLYTPTSITMEEVTGFSYDEAKELRSSSLIEHSDNHARIVRAMLRAVVPTVPEYRPNEAQADRKMFYQRLLKERKVPIIASNPPMATGFLANRILLYLLRDSGVERDIVHTPEMPGYLHFDAAQMISTICTNGWLHENL